MVRNYSALSFVACYLFCLFCLELLWKVSDRGGDRWRIEESCKSLTEAVLVKTVWLPSYPCCWWLIRLILEVDLACMSQMEEYHLSVQSYTWCSGCTHTWWTILCLSWDGCFASLLLPEQDAECLLSVLFRKGHLGLLLIPVVNVLSTLSCSSI